MHLPVRVLAMLFAAIALFEATASAHEFASKDIVILHPWARASAGGAKAGVIYLTIRNLGKLSDVLTNATSPIADRIELHRNSDQAGVMTMERLDRLEIAPESETRLAPNGLHLMAFGLRQSLQKGDRFPLTLNFETAGALDVVVWVQGAGDLLPAD